MRWWQINESKEDQLSKIVWQFRHEMEEYEDWSEHPSCFTGQCMTYAKDLAKLLVKNGFPTARALSGYYNDAEEEYVDFVFWVKPEYIDDDQRGGRWTHWWVEVDGLIVDVTADQFHPSERQNYRVVITNKGDPAYG